MQIPAIAVQRSGDLKLSTDRTVSATWVSQGSCHDECPFKGKGCYAETGRSRMHTMRLNEADQGQYTPEQLAQFEADAIDSLKPIYDLRLHIVGDCRTPESARIVSKAGMRYKKRSGKDVWTFTHAPNIDRAIWGDISILRSVESESQLQFEHDRGYACAMVISEPHIDHKPVKLQDGFKGIPCPQQTGKSKSCKDCRLCMNDKHLHDNKLVILFAPDRGTKDKIANSIANKKITKLPMVATI
jgi:hypothetical protein